MEMMMRYQRKKGSQHIRKAPITTPSVTNALCSFKTVSESTYFFCFEDLIPFARMNSCVVSLLSLGAVNSLRWRISDAAPTFEYAHAGCHKNGTSRPHPCVDYDRPKADPIPHPPSAALRLASASLVRVFGGSHPVCRQILGTLRVFLLKLLFPVQRQFSLQAVEKVFF